MNNLLLIDKDGILTDLLNKAEVELRALNTNSALEILMQAVRLKPAQGQLRIFLVQLLTVMGQYERAHVQLNVMARLLPKTQAMCETMSYALRCELLRAQVFSGQRVPMVFGYPPEWMALLIESLVQAGQGNTVLSADLSARALDMAPITGGFIDGQVFGWIADADSRLGPVLEACINGRYYWIPFERISAIRTEAPVDLRDVVWTPAYLTFANGGEAVAMIPARYPDSHASEDSFIQMARKTLWLPLSENRYAGLGQRVLSTDIGDFDWMAVRHIEIAPQATTHEDGVHSGASA